MNLTEYNTETEQFKPTAKVLSWQISGELAIPRDVCLQAAKDAGIPEKCFPPELRARTKFQRTLKTLSEEDFEQLAGVFHRITEDQHRSVWVWVTHELDPQNEKISFAVERKFVFNKFERTVVADDPEELATYREVYQSLEPDAPDLDYFATEIQKLELQVHETQVRLDNLMHYFAEIMLPQDIRAFMTRCVDHAHGIAMRAQGGVYIIPRQTFWMLEAMKQFLTTIDPSGQSSLRIVNIVDVPAIAVKIKQMASALGLEAADLHGLLDEISSSLNTRDDVTSVFSSFEEHFFGKVADIDADIEQLMNNGRTTREKTLLGRMSELNQVAEQAEIFSSLLDLEANKYKTRIQEVKTKLESFMRVALEA